MPVRMTLGVAMMFASPIWAQTQGAVSLESLMKQPDVRVVMSSESGRLESGRAWIAVTALAVRSGSNEARGARFEYSDGDAQGVRHLDERQLNAVIGILSELNFGISARPPGIGWTYVGSCKAREAPEEYPILADYLHTTVWPGLRILPWGGPQVMLTGKTPTEFTAIVNKAISELKQPR